MTGDRRKELTMCFKDVGVIDVPLAGRKNASLGEMYQNLAGNDVTMPYGFAIPAHAFGYFMEQAGA